LSSALAHHRVLLSFPTRRSSDLVIVDMTEPSIHQFIDRPRNKVGLLQFLDAHFLCQVFLRASSFQFLPMFIEKISNFFSFSIAGDRKSTRLNSSHVKISYAVFCL